MARRKRTSAAGGNSDDDVNLTPMLDVVFILLIFFIVTAQFIKLPGIDPVRESVDNKDRVKPLGIVFAINDKSEVIYDGDVVPENELAFKLKELRRSNPKGEIVVQADRASDAEAMVGLMSVIAEVEQEYVPVNISVKQD